ncbi:hypothetical protein BT96DRAFT_998488 [Gymnopus androsaceus JB14]|uniref:Uncharacterized protein n=1 Tax=Gymnopus androsaceus JB14 TaxID=1447944 RepID=A0A6A4H9S3_9AGAR|nr:hypothetical protein BT96DRAFT_998488 [Gymnopus androsaceus JB14]
MTYITSSTSFLPMPDSSMCESRLSLYQGRRRLGIRCKEQTWDGQSKIVAASHFGAPKQSFLDTHRLESEEQFDRVLEVMEKEWDAWPSTEGLWHWTVAYAQKREVDS